MVQPGQTVGQTAGPGLKTLDPDLLWELVLAAAGHLRRWRYAEDTPTTVVQLVLDTRRRCSLG